MHLSTPVRQSRLGYDALEDNGLSSEYVPTSNVTPRPETSITTRREELRQRTAGHALSFDAAGATTGRDVRLVFPTVTDTSCSATSCCPIPLCWSSRWSSWHVEKPETVPRIAEAPNSITKGLVAARRARRFHPRIVRKGVVGKSTRETTAASGPAVRRSVGHARSASGIRSSEGFASRVPVFRTARSWHVTASCESKEHTAGRVRNRLRSPVGIVRSQT